LGGFRTYRRSRGRTGVRAIADIQLGTQSTLRRPLRTFVTTICRAQIVAEDFRHLDGRRKPLVSLTCETRVEAKEAHDSSAEVVVKAAVTIQEALARLGGGTEKSALRLRFSLEPSRPFPRAGRHHSLIATRLGDSGTGDDVEPDGAAGAAACRHRQRWDLNRPVAGVGGEPHPPAKAEACVYPSAR
jgi:hypothetical protein